MDTKIRLTFFVLFVVSLLLAGSLYVNHRLSRWIKGSNHSSKLMRYSLAIFMVLETIGFASLRLFPQSLNQYRWLYWTVYSFLGLFASLFFYTVVTDLLLYARRRYTKTHAPVDLTRRSALLVGGASLTATLAGAQQVHAGPQVKEIDIPIKGLHPSLNGFKIVQITDLHVGPTVDKQYTEQVVQIANRLGADLIALTGDFVDGHVEHLKEGISPLAQLKSVHGSFYVTGNHEYMWNGPAWIEAFRSLGATPLLNEHRVIQHGEGAFVLAGVTDLHAHRHVPEHQSDPQKSLKGAPLSLPKILLAHQPASYKESAPAGFDLQLSGHTHGGQFIPFNLAVALTQRYYRGLNRHENMWVYVNCGTGYWGPPNRFGIPAEISLIRLRVA